MLPHLMMEVLQSPHRAQPPSRRRHPRQRPNLRQHQRLQSPGAALLVPLNWRPKLSSRKIKNKLLRLRLT